MDGASTTPLPDKPKFKTSDFIELIGNGWYQIFVNGLMGLVCFALRAELMVTPINILALGCEWNLSTLQKALLPGMDILGSAAGSFVGGKIADMYGRRTLLLASSYIMVISSFFAITAHSYYVYIIARLILCSGVSINYPVASVYVHEVSVAADRSFWMISLQTMMVLGGVYACACSLFVMDLAEGWRWECTLALVPVILSVILLHFADESPRYYAANGQYEKAMEVLKNMARWNGVELPEEMELTGKAKEMPNHSYIDFYRQPYTRMSIIMTLLQCTRGWIDGGMWYFVFDAFTYSFCHLSDFFTATYVDEFGCTMYTKTQYFFYLCFVALFLPGLYLGGVLQAYVERKQSALVITWTLTGLCLALLVCIHYTVTMAIIILLNSAIGALYLLSWTMSPELYPSSMRTTSVGILNTFNRVAAAGGSFLTEYVDPYSMTFTISTYCVFALVTSVSCLFINREQKDKLLADTQSEASNYGSVPPSTPEESERGESEPDELSVDARKTD